MVFIVKLLFNDKIMRHIQANTKCELLFKDDCYQVSLSDFEKIIDVLTKTQFNRLYYQNRYELVQKLSKTKYWYILEKIITKCGNLHKDALVRTLVYKSNCDTIANLQTKCGLKLDIDKFTLDFKPADPAILDLFYTDKFWKILRLIGAIIKIYSDDEMLDRIISYIKKASFNNTRRNKEEYFSFIEICIYSCMVRSNIKTFAYIIKNSPRSCAKTVYEIVRHELWKGMSLGCLEFTEMMVKCLVKNNVSGTILLDCNYNLPRITGNANNYTSKKIETLQYILEMYIRGTIDFTIGFVRSLLFLYDKPDIESLKCFVIIFVHFPIVDELVGKIKNDDCNKIHNVFEAENAELMKKLK